MKIDLYTKALLTVIAACLVAIVARDIRFVGVANAATGPQYDSYGNLKVAIEEWNENSDLDVKVTGGSIDAHVTGGSIDVRNDVDVQVRGDWIRCQNMPQQLE